MQVSAVYAELRKSVSKWSEKTVKCGKSILCQMCTVALLDACIKNEQRFQIRR